MSDYRDEAWRRVGRMLFGSSYEELSGYDFRLTQQYREYGGPEPRFGGHRTFPPSELIRDVSRAYFRLDQDHKIDAWFEAKGFDLSEEPISKEEFERLLPDESSKEPSNTLRQKPGPKPDFEWEKIEAKCRELMEYHGEFTPDDPDWDCQARLEEALLKFCQDTYKREPGASTLREKLPDWLSAWRKQKISDV